MVIKRININFFTYVNNKKNFNFNKVGHSGTLDPNADGLMLLATDSYTKLFDYIENTDKTYKATAILGYSSPTLDVDSDLIFHENIDAVSLTKDIENFLPVFKY